MTLREHDTALPLRPKVQNTADQARELDLVTILAHDLRNYITPMYSQVRKMGKRADAEGRDVDLRLATSSIRVLDQMLALVTNVLDLARAERSIFDLSFALVDLCELTRGMASLLARDHHPITVSAPPMLPVRADSTRLGQALHNILSNALHYSPTDAPVELRIEKSTNEHGSWAVIMVRDYGPGIPPEFQLFQQFIPGPNSTGLGIGLYVAQQIAAAHGGNLAVCAVEGPGACFVLKIPAVFDG